MADALISLLIETLGSMAFEKVKKEVGLVTGVEDEVEKLTATLLDIQAVLVDAEKRQHRDAAVEMWLGKLKDVSLDIDDVLDEWLTPTALKSKMDEKASNPAKKKVWLSLLSLCVCSGGGAVDEVRARHRVAQEILDLNARLDEMAKNKDRFKLEKAANSVGALGPASRPYRITTSLLNEKEICGRDVEKEVLIRKLLPTSVGENEHADRGFNIVSLVGIGGLGKTTLAQLAYNDERVKNRFDSRLWVCVSDPFDEIRIARAILKDLNCDTQESDELSYLVQRIHGLVEKKRFLLVLDDVWNENHDKWEELEKALGNGAAGSMIVVTTRKENVASTMGVAKRDMIVLESLSDEHCWLIFSQKAFFDRTEEECRQFEAIGRKIAEKSKGLPLLAKTLGGLMLSKKTISQWNNILKSELWDLKDVEDIFAPFLLSYYDLLPSEKRCLLYCSIFPKDYEIRKDILIRLWMSQGFFGCSLNLEEEGEACFESLSMRSFFQDFKIVKLGYDSSLGCKMHDVVCDFLKFLSKNEYYVVDNLIGPNDNKILLHERLRHLTILVPQDTDIEGILKYNDKKSKLRTLFFSTKWYYTKVLESLLVFHTRVRTLNLASGIPLPRNIGELIHLRYLDLSRARCEELPDEVCDLYNLQTLDLNNSGVKKLPENINKLTNLRYLNMYNCYNVTRLPDSICDLPKLQTLILKDCWALGRLPEGLGKLVELKHLDFSNCVRLVGVPRGILSLANLHKLNMVLSIHKDVESYLNLEDLKSMNHLLQFQDSFDLYGCTNLLNAGEAQDIGIKRMELLTRLDISFKDNTKSEEEEQGIEEHEEQILEGLEPSQKLESLEIEDYMGTTVSPKWMMSLVNLTQLDLFGCPRCVVLPPLGKLPSLEYLTIWSLASLEKVGSEFLGFENDDAEEESCFTPFPKLITLYFMDLCKWESWTNAITTTVMPRLEVLYIEGCRRLKSLPDFLPLSVQPYIRDCDILERNRPSASGISPKQLKRLLKDL